jgi:hypothetical protein
MAASCTVTQFRSATGCIGVIRAFGVGTVLAHIGGAEPGWRGGALFKCYPKCDFVRATHDLEERHGGAVLHHYLTARIDTMP